MIDIIPAIIPESFDDLKDKMSLVKGFSGSVQIDVCDGRFVPSKSWPYVGDENEDFKKLIDEEEGFPFWQNIDIEADLMVKNPENSAENWIKAGVKRIILHIESSENIFGLIKEFRKKYGYFWESPVSIEIGIGINPETPIENLEKYLKSDEEGRPIVDFVQFMGIKKIGYQHQIFDRTVLTRINDLREKYPDVIISVDGGVDFENASELIHAGANRLVSGHTIFESEDIKEAISVLQNMA